MSTKIPASMTTGLATAEQGRNADVALELAQFGNFMQPAYTQIDFNASGDPESGFTRFNLTKQGSGSGNVVQSVAEDHIFFGLYSMHAYSVGDVTVINKFNTFGPATQTSTRWTKTPDSDVGHQGMTLERTIAGGARRFWSSASYNISNSKGRAVRFSISDDGGDVENLIIGNKQTFVLFSEATGDGSSNPTISPDGRLLVAKYNLPGNIVRFRVWRLDVLVDGGAGDYSDDYIHQFDVANFYDATNYPLQGLCTDGAFIYAICGYGDATGPYANKRFGKFSLDGSYQIINNTFTVGLTEALTDGAGGHYEPEGLYITRHGGRALIGCVIASGDSGARVNRVWYLDGDHMVMGRGVGTRPSFYSTGANDYGWAVGETGRLGEWNVDGTWIDHILAKPGSTTSIQSFTPETDLTPSLGSSVLRWLKGWFGNISLFPASSVTPTINGEVTFQLTSNTQLTVKAKGSDGTVRSGNITLS